MKTILAWLEVILAERFGHPFAIRQCGQGKLLLSCDNADGGIVFDVLQSCFFELYTDMPCGEWDANAEGWKSVLGLPLKAPGVAELPFPLVEHRGGYHFVHYDILGLTYWMLSRQEEVGRCDLDEHGRFPAHSSHAYKFGYLQSPIVDEWLNLLGQVIERQWVGIKLKKHHFKILVSHDVDFPSRYGFRSPFGLVRAIAGDLVRYKMLSGIVKGPWAWLNTCNRLSAADPYNTFDWLMETAEKNGLKSAFYFMGGRTNIGKDGDYELEHPAIRNLMRRIHERGHEIGLHPSYGTYLNPEMISKEANHLKEVCQGLGIVQDQWGGRMHYLRWAIPTTLYGWQKAGMSYDSTLGYADHPGFRCGTCYEYPAFDPVGKKKLNFHIKPLIVMEASFLSKEYLGISSCHKICEEILNMKSICQAVEGLFTLLWHNSNLPIAYKNVFSEILGNA